MRNGTCAECEKPLFDQNKWETNDLCDACNADLEAEMSEEGD